MRDVYYQPTGNPIQTDRLPSVSCSVELMAERSHRDAWKNPLWIFGSGAIVLSLSLIHISSDILTVVTSLLAVKLISMPLVLFVISMMILDRMNLSRIHRPLIVGAVMLLLLNISIPLMVRQLLLAATLGLLTYQFGMHALLILTAPPVDPELSKQLQRDARKTVLEQALIVGGGSLAVMTVNSGLFLCLTMVIAAAWVVIRTFRTPNSVWRRLWGVVHSWFCYDPGSVIGLLQSPAGNQINRAFLGMLASVLLLQVSILQRFSPLPLVFRSGASLHQSLDPTTIGAPDGRTILYHVNFAWLVAASAFLVVYFLWPYVIAMLALLPYITDAALLCKDRMCTTTTEAVQKALISSPNRVDQQSLYLGRAISDGSPVFLPAKLFSEHAHALGDSGSGKTSLFLCPVIEQLVNGECSVIVLDLKADSLELLSTLNAANERLKQAGKPQLPLKYFSNQQDCPTFAFNPMTQSYWDLLDRQTQTDIMCAANGLNYGDNYGAGYYSSANSAVLQQAWKMFPDVKTFRELADKLGEVLVTAKKKDLHPEIRKAGVHVHEVIKRLANVDPLNVAADTGHAPEVVSNAIDLTQLFHTPQLLYVHLSATLSPSGAPEIARLMTYMLLAAATKTERKHQVYLVIDEFQRIVANNLEYMLQLARSMGVGIILANQSMEDLKKSGTNLIPAIEANCRLRQWFSVSSLEDRERLLRSSGETVDQTASWQTTTTDTGTNRSVSTSEVVVPRITMNDLLLMSDHPFQSILRISRGMGQAQYGGFPFIIQSERHISTSEYRRRCSMSWPDTVGAYIPRDFRQSNPPDQPKRSGPKFTEETIGGTSAAPSKSQVDEFFNSVEREYLGRPPRPKATRRKRGES